MTLYHISCEKYEVGTILTARESASPFHLKSVENELGWINELLEKHAPDNAPNRSKAYFAFGKQEYCKYYFKSIQCTLGSGPFLYKVELTNCTQGVYWLCRLLETEGQDSELVGSIASEYWEPQENWNVIEYLGEEMKILEKITFDTSYLKWFSSNTFIDDCNKLEEYKKGLQNA